ncbi:MAG: hypothetical protein ACOYM2_12135 [Rectinemataceae bacterium]
MSDLLRRGGVQVRTVGFGGSSKEVLLAQLLSASIMLNENARTLFSSDLFITAASRESARVVEMSVADLGFPEGASFPEILERAQESGLSPCPLELGPYFRLRYLDQREQAEIRKNRAPAGSVTIMSIPLSDSDGFPKGFYLRKIDGALWLRGYTCDMEHRWEPGDRVAFRVDE